MTTLKNQLKNEELLNRSMYLKPEATIYTLPEPLQILASLSVLEVEVDELEDFGAF